MAITKGFKEKYKWWPVMELACRFMFIAIVTLTPGFTVSVQAVVYIYPCITAYIINVFFLNTD